MVNDDLADARAAERRVALSYAPADRRAALAALLELDATLGQIVRSTREPLIGQMRLTWWHDALLALDERQPPAEPVLRALAEHVLAAGVAGARMATIIEGWEALLDPLDIPAIDRAAERGAAMFGIMATMLGGEDATEAGRGWAYADLARHLSDPTLARHARREATVRLAVAFRRRWPVGLRALGALTALAADDVAERPAPPAGLRRVARMVRHRLTGR